MKKLIIFIPVITVIIALLTLNSCSEDNGDNLSNENTNMVLFEDLSLLDNVSTSPLDNHVYRIELLGQNEELERILDETGKYEQLEYLNTFGVKKFYVNNSDIVMYTVPYNTGENNVVIYQYDDMYQVNIAEYEENDRGITTFRLKTTDGALFYGMKFNTEYEAGDFIMADNKQINTFNNRVYEASRRMPAMDDSVLKQEAPNDQCCRRMDDWAGCFECTMVFFSGRWYGLVALATIGKEFTAAVAISCIGAGPDTFC